MKKLFRSPLGLFILCAALIALGVGGWKRYAPSANKNTKPANVIQVVSAAVMQADVLVKLTSSGTVAALQSVDVRPQISAMVKMVHVKEGQFVRKGDRLFTLDTRTEDANLKKAEAQVAKDKADLANAERNLERVKALLKLEYVAQSEFDTAQNLVDGLRSQLAIDLAAVETSRVARSFDEITAPISGRTGVISVYPGNLVQPAATTALVSIAQLDPINISFTLPERELAGLQQALGKGEVPVFAKLDVAEQNTLTGYLSFIDNNVDTSSGTIHLKAVFSNADHRLWPGMFVSVEIAPRSLTNVLTVPAQAVQTGPEKKFLYVIGKDNKVASAPINVVLIQDSLAVVEGVAAGERVVVEGAHNLKPNSVVIAAEKKTPDTKLTQTKNTPKSGANPNSATQP
ncbi:MAG: efflux RND transporter periplasmic adaptor subunit [Gallionella sp.]